MVAMLKIAHRGASGHEVENSLAAFEKAIMMGADGIELDIWQCKSGELIVFHDQFLDRLTITAGLVYEKTLEELQQLRLWFKGEETSHTIPTFQQVIDLIKAKASENFKVYIELKGCDLEQPMVDSIQKNNFHNNAVVISFRHDRVLKIKELDPKIKTGVTLYGVPVNLTAVVEKAQADCLVISDRFLIFRDISSVQKKGHQVLVYTINDAKKVEKLKEKGVDGIMSDFPDRLIN